ncbi:MAG: nickel-dependent hydrogenase large subunit [Archangium sp.]|nr:nickel-dependent hydrogenase large subunit [Archangium sp.]
MAGEGRIDVTIELVDRRISGVSVASSRPLGVWKALEHRAVDEALTLAPLMSSICSTAHGVAGLRACEDALGVEIDGAEVAAREALVAAEVLQNHLWFWLLTAPELMGEPPRMTELRQVRAQLSEVLSAMGVKGGWVRLGGARRTPDDARLERSLAMLDTALASLGVAAAAPPFFEHLTRITGPIGAVFRTVLNAPVAMAGVTAVLDSSYDARAVAAALRAAPGFAARPGPMELGPLVTARQHPLVREATRCLGHGVGARLVARYVETCAAAESLHHFAQNLQAGGLRSVTPNARGQGFGVASTSRGPVLHAVEVEQGQIVAWRVVAPTEWTFHPEGAVREALLGLTAPDVHLAVLWARWVVATLDPCVECGVLVRET